MLRQFLLACIPVFVESDPEFRQYIVIPLNLIRREVLQFDHILTAFDQSLVVDVAARNFSLFIQKIKRWPYVPYSKQLTAQTLIYVGYMYHCTSAQNKFLRPKFAISIRSMGYSINMGYSIVPNNFYKFILGLWQWVKRCHFQWCMVITTVGTSVQLW